MKKQQYISISLTIIYILLFVFCLACASYEIDIRDNYRFLEKMPLPLLTAITCYPVIIFAGLFNIIDYAKKKKVRKVNLIIFLFAIGFVTLTTVKNYNYYSREIAILKQGYVKAISEEELKNLLETDASVMLFIDGGYSEETYVANTIIRRYAYYEQHTVYFFHQGHKIRELSEKSDAEWVSLIPESLPVLFTIENGEVIDSLYYHDIVEAFASWADPI